MTDESQLRLNIFVHHTKGSYYAYCPEFDLAASGASAEEAREAVLTLIDDYLEEVAVQPGDRSHNATAPGDWDSALIAGGLEADRTLN